MRIVVATRNRGKVAELDRLLGGVGGVGGVELVSLDALVEVPEVVEDGATFAENAAKKAREYAAATELPTIADDSGLEVDALGGAPGVSSARYAGDDATDAANNAKLLRALADVPDAARTARFRCVLAFADPAGALGADVHLEDGAVEGAILHAPRGAGGFGYDPLFLPHGGTLTTAELPPDVKDQLSHRGQAARKLRAFLAGYLAARG